MYTEEIIDSVIVEKLIFWKFYISKFSEWEHQFAQSLNTPYAYVSKCFLIILSN